MGSEEFGLLKERSGDGEPDKKAYKMSLCCIWRRYT
jgi:hypothetical protein